MAQYVELPGRAPVHLINEDMAGLDGFSLKSAFKGLKKLARKGLDPLGKALLKKDPITGRLLKVRKKKPKVGNRPIVVRPRPGTPRPGARGPRLVALEAQQPKILLHAGRFEEGLQGLDGFSLKKIGKAIGKGLKKVGKFVDKNKWVIAGAATAAYGGWALASKAAAGKLAAGAGAKAAASAVAKKAGTSLLSKAGSALLKGGKKVVEAATPLATTMGTQMLQNAIAPQQGMEAYGMDPYGMAQGYNAGMPVEAMAQGGWGGGGMPTGETGLPSWVMPVALGGGVLLLLRMMTSNKK